MHLRQKDELATLADAMNQMASGLAAARAQVAAETAARLATLEHLRHADRLGTVGKLASGVAHELGTPLNVVLLRAKMISSGEAEGDETRECALIITQQVQHMTGIIRQLLDFSRRRTPQRAPEDLSVVVVRTLHLLRPLAARRNIVLAFEASGPEGVGSGCRADRAGPHQPGRQRPPGDEAPGHALGCGWVMRAPCLRRTWGARRPSGCGWTWWMRARASPRRRSRVSSSPSSPPRM